MNAVDLIAHQATGLPEARRAEVLDFIGYPEMCHPQAAAAATSDAKLADLAVFFAPYRKDFGSFVFDRD
jgi:hypothetical protein